jgi:Protein of unknown function (DUF3289)
VQQNLISGIKIPLTVTFENIKINECYQYYNRGDENGAIVKTKFDESWGSVVGPDTYDLATNHAEELSKKYTDVIDILEIFDCSTTQKADLTKLIANLEIVGQQAQSNLDYDPAQKAEISAGVAEVKTLVTDLLSCCVASSSIRVNADACQSPRTIQDKTKIRIENLKNFPKPSFVPYVIAKSLHRPTLNHAGTAVHQDMSTSLYTIGMFLDLGGLYLADLGYSKETLLSDIKGYSDISTTDKTMEGILKKMFDRFYTNTSIYAVFEDGVLTQKAILDNSTTNFTNRISESLEFELKKDDNFVRDKKTLRLVGKDQFGLTKYNTDLNFLPPNEIPKYIYDDNGKTDIKRDDFPSPTYTNLANGLKTAINDTWGYDIKIESFVLNKTEKTYKAGFEITIFDHFGIDPTDAREFNHVPQIRKWFILQHKYQCTPFLTTIKFKHTINGSY